MSSLAHAAEIRASFAPSASADLPTSIPAVSPADATQGVLEPFQSTLPSLPLVGGVRGGRKRAKRAKPDHATMQAEAMARWDVQPGQVWVIPSLAVSGRSHRLVIGDCTQAGVVQAACAGSLVNGIVTSPPYADQRKRQYGGIRVCDYVDWFARVQSHLPSVMTDNASFFLNIKPHCSKGQRSLYVNHLVCAMVERWGWTFIDELYWHRHGAPGKWPNRFKNSIEPVYHFALSPKVKFRPLNVARVTNASLMGVKAERIDRKTGSGFSTPSNSAKVRGLSLPSNVIQVNTGENKQGHSATFPIGLPEFFIKAYSDEFDVWLDPFIGSGTTLLACERNRRLCIGIESKPEHGAIMLDRLQASGLAPGLE